ncbi:hypothetical protein J9303_14270 [Bacillaceae bacterium Marseille-Q3522]|nr:hypothetical protein [Bacillaceae bacterium Marseille-Q3522]
MSHKKKSVISFSLLFLLIYLIHFFIVKVPGDDTWFSDISKQFTLMEYIKERYLGWSGRIFPEAMLYTLLNHRIWLWRILNSFFFIILAFSMVRIVKKEVRFFEVVIALVTLGYFSQAVLSSGFFWITGTINYLWPIALGFAGMIPYADWLFRKQLPGKITMVICFLSGFLAAISNEQVGLCMSCFAVLAHLGLWLRKQKQKKILFLFTFFIVSGAAILLLAPGNQVRWANEVARWFPDYEKLSLKGHLYIGTIWFFEKVFREMKVLIFFTSIVALLVSMKDEKIKKKWHFLAFFLLVFLSIGAHVVFEKQLGYLYGFQFIREYRYSGNMVMLIMSLLPYLFWTVYGSLLMFFIINKSEQKFLTVFCLLAAISSLVIIFFSPTIYASGNRVLVVSAVLLAFVTLSIVLKTRILENKLSFAIYSIVPAFNFGYFIITWIVKGYYVLM